MRRRHAQGIQCSTRVQAACALRLQYPGSTQPGPWRAARKPEAWRPRSSGLRSWRRGEEGSKCELRLVYLCSPGAERVLAVAMPWLGRQLRPRRWRGDGRSGSLGRQSEV